MKKQTLLFGMASLLAISGLVGAEIVASPNRLCAAQDKMSFSEDIMPIFQGRCVSCHQPSGQGYEKSGLDLTTYEGVMKGTKFGKMIIPKEPEFSNLIWLLDWKGSPELRMPHGKKKLSSCDRDAIRWWIREGAKNN